MPRIVAFISLFLTHLISSLICPKLKSFQTQKPKTVKEIEKVKAMSSLHPSNSTPSLQPPINQNGNPDTGRALIAPEPAHCPGPASESAGRADPCVGCPNQTICASQLPRAPDPDLPVIASRLAAVKHRILVLSGKGGVGKSTLTASLAFVLAAATATRRKELKKNKGEGAEEKNGKVTTMRATARKEDRETVAAGRHGPNKDDEDDDDDDDDDNNTNMNNTDSTVQIGILDVDICGPSMATMTGTGTGGGEGMHDSGAGWAPVMARDNVAVVSIQFMLPSPSAAVVWRGDKKSGLIKRFLRDVDWGAHLDFLLIDTPPGTSDEHLALVGFLAASGAPSSPTSSVDAPTSGAVAAGNSSGGNRDTNRGSGISGAVVVTTPQETALQDVRRELDFCRKAGLRVLGVVENMAGFACPSCGGHSDVFAASTGGGSALAREFNVPFLGSVPLDPRVAMAGDYGESFFEAYPRSDTAVRLRAVVAGILCQLGVEEEYKLDDGCGGDGEVEGDVSGGG